MEDFGLILYRIQMKLVFGKYLLWECFIFVNGMVWWNYHSEISQCQIHENTSHDFKGVLEILLINIADLLEYALQESTRHWFIVGGRRNMLCFANGSL